MGKYSGWIIAGVVCLIIITLSITGIMTLGATTPSPTPATSSEVAMVVRNLPLV